MTARIAKALAVCGVTACCVATYGAQAAGGSWTEPKRLGAFRGSDTSAGLGKNGYALIGWRGIDSRQPGERGFAASVAIRNAEGEPWKSVAIDADKSDGVLVGIAEDERVGIVVWRNLRNDAIRAAIHSRGAGFGMSQTLSEGLRRRCLTCGRT